MTYLECPCCGDDGAASDSAGAFHDGQALICGCPGWVSFDGEGDDPWINNGDAPCLRCEPASSPDERTGTMADAAEMLWIVLANVSGGDWTQQSDEWRETAARWRDHYFRVLQATARPPSPVEPAETPDAVITTDDVRVGQR